MDESRLIQGGDAYGDAVQIRMAGSAQLEAAHMRNSSLSHPHWWDVEGASQLQHTVIGVFLVAFTVTAIISNILVVSTCLGYRSLRTTSNLLVVNLAAGDLVMCLVDFPLFAAASFFNFWPFGRNVCQMYGLITAMAGIVTINTLAVISADRYRAIVNRLCHHHQTSRPTTLLTVLLIWSWSVLWAAAPVLGWGRYVLDGVGTTCTFDFLTRSANNISFVLAMMAGNFVVPLSVIAFSYFRIWRAVVDAKRRLREQNVHVYAGRLSKSPGNPAGHGGNGGSGTPQGQGQPGREPSQGQRRSGREPVLQEQNQRLRIRSETRTACTILTLVLAFVLAWFPYLVVCMIGLFGDVSLVTVRASVASSLLAKASTVSNPVLYCIMHPKVRRKLHITMLRLVWSSSKRRSLQTSSISERSQARNFG